MLFQTTALVPSKPADERVPATVRADTIRSAALSVTAYFVTAATLTAELPTSLTDVAFGLQRDFNSSSTSLMNPRAPTRTHS